jgi:hypothetical protein
MPFVRLRSGFDSSRKLQKMRKPMLNCRLCGRECRHYIELGEQAVYTHLDGTECSTLPRTENAVEEPIVQ